MRRQAVAAGASSLVVAATLAGCAATTDAPRMTDAASAPSADVSTSSTSPMASASANATTATSAPVTVAPLPDRGVVDYQLGGAYDQVTIGGVRTAIDVVVRDSTVVPLEGAYSICYVNGFQTQPDDASWDGRADLLLLDEQGAPLVDPDWPDEHILDPSTAANREAILAIVGTRITACAESGFDAVEIDNLDTWTRFDGVDRDDAVVLAAGYADLAHSLGLAIAQKNTLELGTEGRDSIGFDFAMVEECAAWDECGEFADVYGDQVIAVEYPEGLDEAGLTWSEACGSDGFPELSVLRDRDLVDPSSDAYVFDVC